MTRTKNLLLAAAAMATLGSAAARAELLLQNNAGQSVLYTVYNGTGQPIAGASGCMRSGGSLRFAGADYSSGRGIYIQGNLRSRTDCSGQAAPARQTGSRILLEAANTTKTFTVWQGRVIVQ